MTWVDGLAAFLPTVVPELVYRDPDNDAPYAEHEVGIVVGPVQHHPAQLVAVTAYGGTDSDAGLRWDEPSIQLRVRGTADERVSRHRAQRLYDALHGLGPLTLPDGSYVQLIRGRQGGPLTLGLDPAGVHEHTVNLAVEIENPTPNRE